MEWIKIKAEHLSVEYSNHQLGALVRYHMFYAQNGRTPTPKEVSALIGKKDLGKAEETLRKLGGTLEELRRKVEVDRENIKAKREQGKARQRNYRLNQESNALRDGNVTKQIREDKIRLDKNIATKPKKVSIDLVDVELSNLLVKEIQKNMPTFKEPNIDGWANHIRLMREQDNRTKEQIEFIIKWAQHSSFWKPNILSTKKLREKFDTLVGQAKRDIEVTQSKKPKIAF